MTMYRFKDLSFKPPSGASLIKSRDAGLLGDADALLKEAQRKADDIIQNAQTHFEAERERGLTEGRAAAELKALERLASEHRQLDQKLGEIEASLAGLVSACVRKIIQSFNDTQLAEDLVHSALTKMRRENKVQIRLPHALMADFQSRVGGLVDTFPEIELIDLIEDASLTPPNAIVESFIGRIECDLGKQLEDLDKVILRVAKGLSNAQTEGAEADG